MCLPSRRHGFNFWDDTLEKKMTIHSSILVWEIPWKEEPGGAIDHRVTKNQTQLGD
jgi:hypothetical protein